MWLCWKRPAPLTTSCCPSPSIEVVAPSSTCKYDATCSQGRCRLSLLAVGSGNRSETDSRIADVGEVRDAGPFSEAAELRGWDLGHTGLAGIQLGVDPIEHLSTR